MLENFRALPRRIIRSSIVITPVTAEAAHKRVSTKMIGRNVFEPAADDEPIRVDSQQDVERLLESGEEAIREVEVEPALYPFGPRLDDGCIVRPPQ